MAVAFNSVNSGIADFTSSLSFALSTSGSDRLVTFATFVASNSINVTAATYDGVALTPVGSLSGNGFTMEFFRLVAPATGSNTCSVTWSGSSSVSIGAMSWTGVDQTTPVSGFQSNLSGTSSNSVTVSSSVGDFVVDAIAHFQSQTVGSGQTQRYSVSTFDQHSGSTEPGASPNVAMSWSFSIGDNTNLIAMNINQVAAVVRRIFNVT